MQLRSPALDLITLLQIRFELAENEYEIYNNISSSRPSNFVSLMFLLVG